MLRFPALNSTVTVPLFRFPQFEHFGCPTCGATRGEDPPPDEEKLRAAHEAEHVKFKEGLGRVELVVRLVDLDKQKQLNRLMRKVNKEERARLREMKKEFSEQDLPELYSDTYSTDEGEEALIKLARDVLKELLVGIKGFEIGSGDNLRNISTVTNVDELIKYIEMAKWHAQAMRVAIDAQRVKGDQILS